MESCESSCDYKTDMDEKEVEAVWVMREKYLFLTFYQARHRVIFSSG